MTNDDKLLRNLNWYKGNVEVPLYAYLIASVILWVLFGGILLIIERYQDLSSITTTELTERVIIDACKGLFFGIIMRYFSNYQYKKLLKKLEQSDKD